MEKMYAWVYERPNVIEYKQIDRPICGDDQLLVKIDTACICNGSDPGILHGHPAYSFRHVFGHEPYGEVVEIGRNVEGYSLGDRVTWWFSVGAFAQYCAITPSELTVLKLPECVTREVAPITELMIASARAVRNEDITPDTRLLIVGLGPSGLVMAQRAKALGAAVVVGWDLYVMRREVAHSVGCDAVFDPAVDVVRQTSEFCHEFDLIIDAMSDDILPNEPTFNKAISLAKRSATVISYGHPERGRRFSPFLFQSKNLTMTPPENDMDEIRKIASETLKMVENGTVKMSPMISKVLPLHRADEALRLTMEEPDRYLKIILDCTLVEDKK